MSRRTAGVAFSLIAVVTFGGCSLFAPRPVPLDRPRHVIIVGIDGLKPADIAPDRTPHLYRMQRDGAYTWNLQAKNPNDRVAVYAEALTATPYARSSVTYSGRATSFFARLRLTGRTAISIVRTSELASLDPAAIRVQKVSSRLDDPVAVGALAAAELLRRRPACMFVELSAGRDPVEESDAGLGKIFAAISHAGAADRTTVIVLSAEGPKLAWMIRGPDIRHGHKLAAPIFASSTAGAAAYLLLPVVTSLDVARTPQAAFRAYSREPDSRTERVVPRGSIRGQVIAPDGDRMPKPSVLLVEDEPVDGIVERWADANSDGEFRFDSIPAGRYDYVFVFDNLPSRLRRSLLVARDLEVKRDTTVEWRLRFRRVRGPDAAAPVAPPAETAAAFLDDDQIETLVRACRAGLGFPLLAADALSGRRARTSQVREWLIRSAGQLRAALQERPTDSATVAKMIDLAAAYDLNRASGLLTDTEEREVRAELTLAAVHLLRTTRKGLSQDSQACLALALIAGAVRPSKFSSEWLDAADAMFEKRLAAVAEQAERDPCGIDHEELCLILEYAMVNRALGCGNYVDDELERVVGLAADSLTPAQRRASPASRTVQPAQGLSFLGLAKSAFANRELGERTRGLWKMCGSPTWTPRGDESLAGALLTAGATPPQRPLGRVESKQLTRTTAVLTKNWGTPSEWLIRVNGWNIDIHVGAAKLAELSTRPLKEEAICSPRVLRLLSSPAYDYVLLGGRVPLKTAQVSLEPCYRHVLFNKLTGYVVISDEFPPGVSLSTEAKAAGSARGAVIVGAEGVEAQVLALAARRASEAKKIHLLSTSSRPSLVICPPPPGARPGATELRTWDVTVAPLSEDRSGAGGAHLLLSADRGAEFIRLARAPAHVAGNVEDNMLEGCVGIIRRGAKSVDLILADARWAQSDDLLFRLERGSGYATVHDSGRAEGWSQGRSRKVTLWLGEEAPSHPSLTVDGRRRKIEKTGDRAVFWLPSGAHAFRIR